MWSSASSPALSPLHSTLLLALAAGRSLSRSARANCFGNVRRLPHIDSDLAANTNVGSLQRLCERSQRRNVVRELSAFKVDKMVEKAQSNRMRIDGMVEELHAAKIDLEANQIKIEMLKDKKQDLLAEITQNSKLDCEYILNSLSANEFKQQNKKLRQAVSSLAQNFDVERDML